MKFYIQILFLFVYSQSISQNIDSLRMHAAVNSDTLYLNKFLHPNLEYIHSLGFTENKPQFIRSITSRKIVYEKFEFIDRKLIHSDNKKSIYRGIVRVVGQYESSPFDVKLAFTSIYQVNQLIYWQSTKLK